MIIPSYLKPGDTVGILAPSRAVSKIELAPFIAFMQEAGFKVKLSEHLFGRDRQFSGSIQERVQDMHTMFLDVDVKAVFSARGGYGAAQLLPYLDWDLIRDHPKWLVGFSDATALHAGFQKGMETIHGVMPYSLAMEEPQDDESFRLLLATLMGERIRYDLEGDPMNVSGQVTGRLVGGNLSVLASIAGTKYEPNYEHAILFLEDLDEYVYHIDRMILHLELRDVFRKIGGLIVGDFSDMHDNEVSFGRNAFEIIAERSEKYKIPSLFSFPAGHKKFNFPLIFGRLSTLRVEDKACSLQMY